MAAAGRMPVWAVLMIGLCLTLLPRTLRADSFSQNVSLSHTLTGYLQVNNHFPLVRAQVLDNKMGDRKVILFGFVASSDERITAELRATEYLGDPWVDIVDQLKIRPELRAAERPQNAVPPVPAAGATAAGASSAAAAAPAAPTNSLGEQTPNDIQAYEDQFQTEMLGPGFASLAGAVPFLGAGTLVGLPFFVGIPVFGLAPLASNTTTSSASNPAYHGAPAGAGLVGGRKTGASGAGNTGLSGVGGPKGPGAFGANRPGFENGAMFNHFRPVGGLGRH